MASRKLNHLEIEEDFKLIGIHSQPEAYKLAFNLNKSLKISLKVFDYKIKIDKTEFVFEMFKHLSEIYNTKIYLFSNKSIGNIKPMDLNLFENIDSKIYYFDGHGYGHRNNRCLNRYNHFVCLNNHFLNRYNCRN